MKRLLVKIKTRGGFYFHLKLILFTGTMSAQCLVNVIVKYGVRHFIPR